MHINVADSGNAINTQSRVKLSELYKTLNLSFSLLTTATQNLPQIAPVNFDKNHSKQGSVTFDNNESIPDRE